MTDLLTPTNSRTSRRRAVVSAAMVVAVVAVTALILGRNTSMQTARSIAAPPTSDLTSVAGSRVFFGHQSVGDNILGAMPALYEDAALQAPRVVEIGAPVTDTEPFFGHAHVGTNGDPASKIAAFGDLMRGGIGGQVDVALLKFCYVDVDSTTDPQALFEQYTSAMAALQAAYPQAKLIYTTVPLTTDRGWKAQAKALLGKDDHMGPADNVVRERYNALVRERYAGTGRLFDIAKVESTNPDGSQARRESGGSTYYVLSEDLALDPGHLNAQGSTMAATELVRVIATSRGQ
ncbi:MAG: SGNH/GDSL hydrolase family protein [Dermatophilaceae bacterium]